MKLHVFDCQKKEESAAVYYPQYTTEWFVEYRSIFGKRKEKITMMTDRVRGGSSIADQRPSFLTKEVEPSAVMEAAMDEKECIEEAHETVRRYYLHHARSWSVPKIKLLSSSAVYVPYHLIEKSGRWRKKKKTFLYEPMTDSADKVEKFPEIYQFIDKEAEKV
ncbi:hypothetical protein ACE1TI_00885 [Alteribacillus sp. JSM 102045]|uniref:hypothetical protein n=1 Tax=Alteribacillus sp. JSM 102045 TaxID=1562101 RepID=UPI0035C2698E